MTKKLTLVCMSLVMAVALFAGCSKKAPEGAPAAAGKAPAAATVSAYNAPDGSFSIAFPEQYKDVKVENQKMQGAMKMATYTAGSEKEHIMFMVSQMTMQIPKGVDINKALEGGLKGMAGTGTIMKQGKADIGGNPALTARVKKAQGSSSIFMEWAEMLVNNTQFQLMVVTDDEKKLDSPDVQNFIKSFKYTGAKAAAPAAKPATK
jgi:hypothetical protein